MDAQTTRHPGSVETECHYAGSYRRCSSQWDHQALDIALYQNGCIWHSVERRRHCQLVSWGIISITVLRCPNVSAVDLAQALVRMVKKLDHVNVAVVTHLKTKDQAGTLRAMIT
ncbi:hypothetical protein BGZ75_009725, partial [Mortierella antarctica]